MSTYNKPFLTPAKQLRLLQARGMEIADVAHAERCLGRIGYYRLSAYWYPFRERIPGPSTRGDSFVPGTSFTDAVDLYVFDKKLRLTLLDPLERIEIAIRVAIALRLGARDPFALTNPNEFYSDFIPRAGDSGYAGWLARHDSQVRKSKEEFVERVRLKYGLPLPIWISIDSGTLGCSPTSTPD